MFAILHALGMLGAAQFKSRSRLGAEITFVPSSPLLTSSAGSTHKATSTTGVARLAGANPVQK